MTLSPRARGDQHQHADNHEDASRHQPPVEHRRVDDAGGYGQAGFGPPLIEQPNGPNALPLAHSALVHGSPADVGPAAVIDSIRGVRVSLASTDDAPGNASERIRSISRVIWLPNAGQAQVRVCGDEPMFGSLVTANVMDEEGVPVIEVTWFPAVDETGGEEDIVRYVVWKRLAGESSWGDPYLSVPAGSEASSYSHIDRDVQSGQAYEYAVAAQDCTPTLSPLVIAGPVLAEISNP